MNAPSYIDYLSGKYRGISLVSPQTIPYPTLLYGLAKLLNASGFPKAGQPYFLAQTMMESGDENSPIARDDNNFSGIQFINKPYQVATASKLHTINGKPAAHFASPGAWADDYKRILSLDRGKGRPIDATSAQQFYERLLANKYFTKNEADRYQTAFNASLRKVNAGLTQLQSQQAQQVQAMNNGGTTTTGDWNFLDTLKEDVNKIPTWAKVAGGAAAVLIIVKAIRN